MSPEYLRILEIESIKNNFDLASVTVGVMFEGSFITTENELIENPYFQYDTYSRNLLLEAKDDERIPYWRSLENKSIILDNEKKNNLYELLKFTYFMKFAESRQAIDNL